MMTAKHHAAAKNNAFDSNMRNPYDVSLCEKMKKKKLIHTQKNKMPRCRITHAE